METGRVLPTLSRIQFVPGSGISLQTGGGLY